MRQDNCCSPGLYQKVNEDFEKLDFEFRGGVIYLKLIFDHVLIFLNDHVIVGMQKLIKNLVNKGLRIFPNESVRDMSIATEDTSEDVLSALCTCSHEKFWKQFDTLRTIHDNAILGIGATLVQSWIRLRVS